MFGHQNDDQTTQLDSTAPAPDATLTANNQVTPISEAAGEYIPTEVPGQPSQAAVDPTTTPPRDAPASAHVPLAADDGLLTIKQQALQQLTPLIDHLEQTPEEKFRTTMMMIQASDNAGLISQAYEAAQGITDEKARAQALLDIVNEINYFTQQQGTNDYQAAA